MGIPISPRASNRSFTILLTHSYRIIDIPFPTQRLAQAAYRSLSVDEELSALVKRDFDLVPAAENNGSAERDDVTTSTKSMTDLDISGKSGSVLRVHYKATTPRMLRVAVNGFFESLSVVVQVMEELDADVLHEKEIEGLDGVQGVEQGLTGTVAGVGS